MSEPAKRVTTETFAHNGAGILWLPAFRKYGIYDSYDVLHGFRRELDAARELAKSLPGRPPEPEPPPRISRSPRAMPLPEIQYGPTAPPADERPEFFSNGMSPWRQRTVGRPSER